MPLSTGTRLGPYEILASIGEGGMGQVYKARDTRLGRSVAIKVVAEEFSNRFEREARAISGLNHPHICTLYDVGPGYLVMELVEGETLAARLQRGRLPMDDVRRYGAEIADALAAAHASGIIHRDLKPANLMMTKSGIKVLDFGVARIVHPDETLTASHIIQGTPAYMAPEQREGKRCDARTDIYSLGLVLYEMATGKRLKQGETAILDDFPERFAHVIERCLESEPEDRWQSVRDVKAELRWAAADPGATSAGKARPRWIWAFAALVPAAIAAGFVLRDDPPRLSEELASQFSITLPTASEPIGGGEAGLPKPSPDSRYFALVDNTSGGNTMLFLRPVDSALARALPGTEGALPGLFCWSPDSRWIAFHAGGKLKKISVTGGTPQTIAMLPMVQDPAWGKGSILFRTTNRAGLSQIPEAGGEVVELTRLDASRGENSHRHNSFLPDGRRFLFTARCTQRENNALYLGSLDTGKTKRLMPIQSPAQYIPPRNGHPGVLVYYLEGSLVSRRFDLDREEIAGEAVPVYEGVGYDPTSLVAGFSISADGRIAVVRSPGAGFQLTWHERNGKAAGTLGPPRAYQQRLSPDGAHAVFSAPDPRTGNRDVFVIEVARGAVSPISTHVANDWSPVWSPDSKQLLFGSDRAGRTLMNTYLKRSLDPSAEELPFPGSSPFDWSRDGKWISFIQAADIWVAPASPDGKPFAYLTTGFQENAPRFSPDRRWLAYGSNETGRTEVFVRPFTGGPAPAEGKIQISTSGGDSPVWNQDGRELYFLTPTSEIFAVDTQDLVRSRAAPRPSRLFRACEGSAVVNYPYASGYDTIDGKRFLITCAPETRGGVSVLLNWPFAGKQ